eukprot:1135974-Rhodomonas_salina.1
MVIGIDMSDIIDDAREIVRANGFEDKITLIKGKVEEVTLPVSFGNGCCGQRISMSGDVME